jgi:hypothetical protein
MASYAATIAGANSTVGTGNNAPTNANDATFRGWTQLVANGFISAGWTRATDTGNVNFATVSTPGAALTNFSAGYDIFHMNDTLQATAPVFVKVEYGSAAANTIPAIWLTIGSGSNGAGTITGPASTRQQLPVAAANTNGITSFISGDTNRIHMGLWCFSNTTFANTVAGVAVAVYFSIERTKDASGVDTNEGVLFVAKTNGITYQQYWNQTTGPTGMENSAAFWGALMPSPNIGTTTAVQSSFYPIYHSKGVFVNPGMGTLCFVGSTTAGATVLATEGSVITIPIYGNNHVYMPMSAVNNGSIAPRSQANGTFCMRYE